MAGAVGVKVVKSDTEAFIGKNTKVNQTAHGAAQDVKVSATDTVTLRGGGGAAAGALAGVGATAEINIVRNTTTAYLGDSVTVNADRDLSVSANSTKDVQAAAVAASFGGYAGVSVPSRSASSVPNWTAIRRGGIGNTASGADSTMKTDNVTGNMGDSQHLAATKSDIHARTSGLSVSGDLNETSTSSLDKTRAYVGSNAQIVTGGKVTVSATDRTQLDLHAVGAAGGAAGIGGAIGIGITNSTTEAFIGTSSTVDADGDVTVSAEAGNVNATGSKVLSAAGAGGVVGVSRAAAVAVLDDTSTTKAYLGNSVDVQDAAKLKVSAKAKRKSVDRNLGGAAGGLAIGASVARSTLPERLQPTSGPMWWHASTLSSLRQKIIRPPPPRQRPARLASSPVPVPMRRPVCLRPSAQNGERRRHRCATGRRGDGDRHFRCGCAGPRRQRRRRCGRRVALLGHGHLERGSVGGRQQPGDGRQSQRDCSAGAAAGWCLCQGRQRGVERRPDRHQRYAGRSGNACYDDQQHRQQHVGDGQCVGAGIDRHQAGGNGLRAGGRHPAAGANVATTESTTTTHATLGDNVNIAAGMTGSVSVDARGRIPIFLPQ